MKKVLIVAIVVLAAGIMVLAQGQDKQKAAGGARESHKKKVAVYITGTEPPTGARKSHTMVARELAKALNRSGKYSAIDRTQAYYEYKPTNIYGSTYDMRMRTLGRVLGAPYLCSIDISEGTGGFYLEVRLIDVEKSGLVVKKAFDASDLNGVKEITLAAKRLADRLVNGSADMPVDTGRFTDARDGKTYRTVTIWNKTWMAENLNYQTENSVCYDNEESNCQQYGRLYDWNSAMKACPAGWSLPHGSDWEYLASVTGGQNKSGSGVDSYSWTVAGKSFKSKAGWSSNGNGPDSIGFSALPGGNGYTDRFGDAGYVGYWWSASESGSNGAWGLRIYGSRDYMDRYNSDKTHLYSVRCLR